MSTDDKKALAKKAPLTPLEKWKDAVFKPDNLVQLARALQGTGYNAERFAHAAYMVVARNDTIARNLAVQDEKELARYKAKLWLGVYAAAECGLSLQPHLQHMHLVPYAKEVQPIIGYKGHIYLVSKSAGGLMTPPVVVFDRDIEEHRFKYREGTRALCELDPVVRDPSRPRGKLRYVFATFRAPNGVVTFKCMEREEFIERREKSAGWRAFKAGTRKTSPWEIQTVKDGPQSGSETGDWLPMCCKTVVRDFAKSLPASTDHWGERAAKADAIEAIEDGSGSLGDVLDATFEESIQETANQKLDRKLGDEEAQIEG